MVSSAELPGHYHYKEVVTSGLCELGHPIEKRKFPEVEAQVLFQNKREALGVCFHWLQMYSEERV